MTHTIELVPTRTEDGRTQLCVPEVGLFTAAKPTGQLVSPGASVGFLVRLGIGHRLVAPAGVSGRIVSQRPERVHEPVGYGAVLYELEPLSNVEAALAAEDTAQVEGGGMVLGSPHTGRFWHRPSPDEPAFCSVGDLLEPGSAVGLVEIMKTFTQVSYDATGGMPQRARVTAMRVGDGGDVEEGDPLIEVEPA
ncbi:MAG: hypothetical protein P1V81_12825 [Planctomycetota bacterium]|nr:hypothetical protein [Planctomycetota bacterium]